MSDKITVLGTEYKITVKKYEDDATFEKNNYCGYCDPWAKTIVICDMSTYKGWENEPQESIVTAQKENLRHEIVHAFTHESGLWDCSNGIEIGWAKNEEFVDWMAIQGPKIYRAWEEAEAL